MQLIFFFMKISDPVKEIQREGGGGGETDRERMGGKRRGRRWIDIQGEWGGGYFVIVLYITIEHNMIGYIPAARPVMHDLFCWYMQVFFRFSVSYFLLTLFTVRRSQIQSTERKLLLVTIMKQMHVKYH